MEQRRAYAPHCEGRQPRLRRQRLSRRSMLPAGMHLVLFLTFTGATDVLGFLVPPTLSTPTHGATADDPFTGRPSPAVNDVIAPSSPQRRLPRTRLLSSPLGGERRVPHPEVAQRVYQDDDIRDRDWGVVKEEPSELRRLEFPATPRQVVDSAFEAIAGTVHDKTYVDPNIAVNAMSKNAFGHRPVRKRLDACRMGIELDGANLLFPDTPAMTSDQALRRLSLMLAAKLSVNEHWKEYEEYSNRKNDKKNKKKRNKTNSNKSSAATGDNTDDEETTQKDAKEKKKKKKPFSRPVVLYFNTVKQALMASKELRLLREEEQQRTAPSHGTQSHDPSSERSDKSKTTSVYDNIIVKHLGDDLPKKMQMTKRRKYGALNRGDIEPERGLVLLVKPTDYNNEYRPPGPAVDAVSAFQSLSLQATVNLLPIVAISPRFMSNTPPTIGWDQSGYQRSSVYGGTEPPKGPTPWIMRDFTPPIFSWISDGLRIGMLRQPRKLPDDEMSCELTRVCLSQSVMYPDHMWRMFIARECYVGKKRLPATYHYLASTRSASGRPTRAILENIIKDTMAAIPHADM